MDEIKLLKTQKNTNITKQLDESSIDQIISLVKEKVRINPEQLNTDAIAIALITGVFQSGDTNRGAGSTVRYQVETYSLNAQELQKIVTQVEKKNGTNRQ